MAVHPRGPFDERRIDAKPTVIPAEAGIQECSRRCRMNKAASLDFGLRRNDGEGAVTELDEVDAYCAVNAPSTAMARPVTSDAASEQGQATASAISPGVPLRPMGWRVGMAAA